MHSNSLLLVAGAAAAVSANVGAHHGGHAHLHNKKNVDYTVVWETVTEYVTVTAGDPVATMQILEQIVSTTASTTKTSSSTSSSSSSTSSTPPTSTSKSTPTSTYVAPTTTTSSAKASTSTTSSSSSGSGSSGVSGSVSTYTDFSCTSSSKRATVEQIAYTGYVGDVYGCNMMLVDSSIASEYQYAIDFTNSASTSYQVICWNKYGADGLLDGWYKGKGQPIDFTLAAGASQAVAFYPGSMGACTVGEGSVPVVTKSGTNPLGGYYETGAYAGTWAEFDFGDAENDSWSGFDVSTLLAQRNAETVYGLKVCSAQCSNTCSSIAAGAATSSNAYIIGTEDADGIGGNCAATKLLLTATIG